MDGILNILKPTGMTSHDVVAYLRRVTGIKRIGHTGTLDPGAAGVLPVCIGKATKAVEYITDGSKRYRAEVKLGIETDTADSYGTIISQKDWKQSIIQKNYHDTIYHALHSFLGKSYQIPPMYSAIKINGQKLYELARKGKEIDREPREIEIYEISLIDSSYDSGTALIDVKCSKGTYIRTLCEDIGKKMGCGAHMSFLLRTEVSGFTIDNAVTLEEVTKCSEKHQIESIVMDVGEVFSNYPRVDILSEDTFGKLQNGLRVSMDNLKLKFNNNELVAVYYLNKFKGLANTNIEKELMYIKFEKQF